MYRVTKWLGILTLILGVTQLAYSQTAVTIEEARNTAEGETVTVTGVLQTPDFGFSSSQFFIQDTTAGINVFYSDGGGNANSGLAAGDSVEVTGDVGSFNEQIQIAASSVTNISSGNDLFTPAKVDTANFTVDSDLQGSRVRLSDVTLVDPTQWPTGKIDSGSGVNVDVETASGDTLTLRIDRDESFFDESEAPQGSFSVAGVLGRFNETPQLFPFFEEELAEIFNVSFIVNTSTVVDTLNEDDVVQIRGAVDEFDRSGGFTGSYLGQEVNWGSTSSLVAQNIGGDYWQIDARMHQGDTLIHKFWTGFELNAEDDDIPTANGGWESGANNIFGLPDDASSDTTTDVIYYNRQSPFSGEKSDTVAVFFRVNVGAQIQTDQFNPETDTVGIRGSVVPVNWDNALPFDEETPPSENNNSFYSSVVYFNADTAANNEELEYKFVIEQEDGDIVWESGDNKITPFPTSRQDTTIQWDFFNGEAPTSEEPIDITLNFSINVGALEEIGLFSTAVGDTVTVPGEHNGWDTGQEMSFQPLVNAWTASADLSRVPGSTNAYKYFVNWDDSRFDESSDNFLPGINPDAGWEEPGPTGGADRVHTFTDEPTQQADFRNDGTDFYNGIPRNGVITSNNSSGNVSTTIRINMEPATNSELLTSEELFVPAEDSVYFLPETPFFALTQEFIVGDSLLRSNNAEALAKQRMTDEDGDMVYEIEIPLQLPAFNNIGYVIGYGKPLTTGGKQVVNGGGFEKGRRYYQFIQPDVVSESSVTYADENVLEVFDWKAGEGLGGELNLDVQTIPDFGGQSTPIEDEELNTPNEFKLSQNYPNPFNPSTTINFTVPQAAEVTLTVYNVLGQEVAQLVNQRMSSGTHSVQFDASGLSSGMYIYRLEAGNNVQNKQMMLVK